MSSPSILLNGFPHSSGNHSHWQVHFDAALSIIIRLPFLQHNVETYTSLQLYFLRSLTVGDVIAGTTLCREPVMFIRHIHDLNTGLGIDKLSGCNDRVLSGINQGAQLDAWKAKQRLTGELSIVELYKAGSRILTQLWEGTGMVEGLSAIVAETFRCAAVIYINLVMSGLFPIQPVNSRGICGRPRNKTGGPILDKMHRASITTHKCAQACLLANRCRYSPFLLH